MTANWIEVDPRPINIPKKQKVNGVEVTVMMSPYDVPKAFRGRYDPDLQRFTIEFRYLGDEETKEEPAHRHVILKLGKNSGRLYGVILDVDAMKAKWVQLVMLALEEHAAAVRRPQRLENYAAAGQLISQNAPQLQEAMAG